MYSADTMTEKNFVNKNTDSDRKTDPKHFIQTDWLLYKLLTSC